MISQNVSHLVIFLWSVLSVVMNAHQTTWKRDLGQGGPPRAIVHSPHDNVALR